MAQVVWPVSIAPRGAASIAPEQWQQLTDATEFFIKQGATIVEKFDDNAFVYGPSYFSNLKLKFLNPEGLFSGQHDPRSIFRMSGRHRAIVYIGEFYSGLGSDVDSREYGRLPTASLTTTGMSSMLRTIPVPRHALIPGIRAAEFIRRCLSSADGILPAAFSPFKDVRDEVERNPVYESLTVDDPSPFDGENAFDAMATLCAASDTVIRVGRYHCGVFNRAPYPNRFGSVTVHAEDLFGRTIEMSDGYDRIYTSAEIEHGGEGDDIQIAGRSGGAEFAGRKLSLDLSFINNRFRAAELGEQILGRLGFPVREVRFQLAGAGNDSVSLLSEIDLQVFWDEPGRQNIHGRFYVVETRRDLNTDLLTIRAQRSKI